MRLLDASGAVYLDTQESRGLVPADHPAFVGAVRAAAMTEADAVLMIGRKLDYQLGYGSPAVFPNARFIRIADTPGELIDNRRGQPELLATRRSRSPPWSRPRATARPSLDKAWAEGLRRRHRERMATARLARPSRRSERREDSPARDLRCHRGGRRSRLHRGRGRRRPVELRPRGLEARTYMDAGAFGCLGVGVPFAIAAALALPDRQVISVNGDGAFGINAMEIDTAVRHGAKAVFIVSNNAAWNIERFDQEMNYGGRVVGTTLAPFRLRGDGARARRPWRARRGPGRTAAAPWSGRSRTRRR